MTKNADIDKYGYSGYGIAFDRRSSFSFPDRGFGQNVLIFGVDMSSYAHSDNEKKDILVLEKGPTQGLEDTLTAQKTYSINFTVKKRHFAQAYITMEQIGICLLMVRKFINSKQKILILLQLHYILETFQKIGQ